MKKYEIEQWARRLIESLQKDGNFEDSFADIKGQLPDPRKAARQIAGLANAAQWESALWVVGVDEKTGKVTGADRNDLAEWWPQVTSYFDGPYPEMTDIIVESDPKPILAMRFVTDQPPYTIKVDRHVEREVPWREGTSTRSAKRSELLRILAPQTRNPEIVVLNCSYEWMGSRTDPRQVLLTLNFYVIPRRFDLTMVMWGRQCTARAVADGKGDQIFTDAYVGKQLDLGTIGGSGQQLVINGPGEAELRWLLDVDSPIVDPDNPFTVYVHLKAVGAHVPCTIPPLSLEWKGASDRKDRLSWSLRSRILTH
jgi:hypothetical protein